MLRVNRDSYDYSKLNIFLQGVYGQLRIPICMFFIKHHDKNITWNLIRYLGDSIIRGTFSTWHVEKQNILESLKFLYKYFIRVLRVQKK